MGCVDMHAIASSIGAPVAKGVGGPSSAADDASVCMRLHLTPESMLVNASLPVACCAPRGRSLNIRWEGSDSILLVWSVVVAMPDDFDVHCHKRRIRIQTLAKGRDYFPSELRIDGARST